MVSDPPLLPPLAFVGRAAIHQCTACTLGTQVLPVCFQQFCAQAFAGKAEVDDGVQVIDKRDDDRGG